MPKVQFGEVLLWQIFNCIHRFFAILAFEIQRPKLIFKKMQFFFQKISLFAQKLPNWNGSQENKKNSFLYGMASKLLF